jgi:hypothetical protein
MKVNPPFQALRVRTPDMSQFMSLNVIIYRKGGLEFSNSLNDTKYVRVSMCVMFTMHILISNETI